MGLCQKPPAQAIADSEQPWDQHQQGTRLRYDRYDSINLECICGIKPRHPRSGGAAVQVKCIVALLILIGVIPKLLRIGILLPSNQPIRACCQRALGATAVKGDEPAAAAIAPRKDRPDLRQLYDDATGHSAA